MPADRSVLKLEGVLVRTGEDEGGFIVTESEKQGFDFMASLAARVEQSLCTASWQLLGLEGPTLRDVRGRVSECIKVAAALKTLCKGCIDEAEAEEKGQLYA